MGVFQEDQTSYFLSNAMINKVLSDVSSIPAARGYICFVPKADICQLSFCNNFVR